MNGRGGGNQERVEHNGPRVERDMGEYWLTWEDEAMNGIAWEYKQRRMSRLEIWLYKFINRIPKP